MVGAVDIAVVIGIRSAHKERDQRSHVIFGLQLCGGEREKERKNERKEVSK